MQSTHPWHISTMFSTIKQWPAVSCLWHFFTCKVVQNYNSSILTKIHQEKSDRWKFISVRFALGGWCKKYWRTYCCQYQGITKTNHLLSDKDPSTDYSNLITQINPIHCSQTTTFNLICWKTPLLYKYYRVEYFQGFVFPSFEKYTMCVYNNYFLSSTCLK